MFRNLNLVDHETQEGKFFHHSTVLNIILYITTCTPYCHFHCDIWALIPERNRGISHVLIPLQQIHQRIPRLSQYLVSQSSASLESPDIRTGQRSRELRPPKSHMRIIVVLLHFFRRLKNSPSRLQSAVQAQKQKQKHRQIETATAIIIVVSVSGNNGHNKATYVFSDDLPMRLNTTEESTLCTIRWIYIHTSVKAVR